MSKFFLFSLTYCMSIVSFSQNPVIAPQPFTADPAALVYDGNVYLYTGHDEAALSDTDYRMDEWLVFSSDDMVNWTNHGAPLSVNTFDWATSHAFAGQCVERNGMFYWYVPMIVAGEFFSIGVAVADNPTGPFADAIGKPLIADAMTPDLHFDIDPSVFIDDDGQAYMYWGNATENGPLKMVRLHDDMVSVQGSIETVDVPDFTEAPYLHKKNGTYYLSYASGWPEKIVYCTSPSATGPWTYRGVINELMASATNHQSIIEFNGIDYFIYHNAFAQYQGGDYRRSVCIDYLYYNSDGTIRPIVPTATGVNAVGQNDALVFADDSWWLSSEVLIEAHDPTFMKDENGTYTLLNTNNMLRVRQSANMIDWTSRGNVIASLPSWVSGAGIGAEDVWAPFIHYREGQYWCYYSVSSFGSNSSAIGLATNKTLDVNSPDYKWVDQGVVFRSGSSNNYNAIDPEVVIDQGRLWMVFGSFWDGIKMIELDPVTGKQKSGSTVRSLASRGGSGIEGPAVIAHDGEYFLFTAWDKCCAGLESTYRTMVGKSPSMTGTFVDKNGKSLLSGGGTQLLGGYGRYYGPGGGSAVEIENRHYFIHHYYNGNENGFPRTHIREIVWDDTNWPIITQPFLGRRQSFEAEHAQLINVEIASGSGNVSNGEYVAFINYDDSKVLFHVNAQQAGLYIVVAHYSAGLGNASHSVVVNGSHRYVINYPQTDNWGDFPVGQMASVSVTLKKGYNSISFGVGDGFAELDKIDLVKHSEQILEAGSYDNSNSVKYMASDNAIILNEGKYVQYENILFVPGNSTVQLQTNGGCAGIISFSLGDLNSDQSVRQQVEIASATAVTIPLNETFQSASGIYDLYIQMESGSCALDNFEFVAVVKDCNGDINGTAMIDRCGVCASGNTGISPCSVTVVEAEDACFVDGTIDSDNSGFSGTGFVNTANEIGSAVSWIVESEIPQQLSFTVAYANGSGTSRNASLLVNGSTQIQEVEFLPSDSWTHWIKKDFSVQLQAGQNDLSLVSLTESGGVNYDYISYPESQSVLFSCSDSAVQVIELNQGWNLVSFAIELSNSAVNTIFPGVSVVKNDTAFYDASNPAYFNSLHEFVPGEGYFVYSDKKQAYTFEGKAVRSWKKSLTKGWNIIGMPWTSIVQLEDALRYFDCNPLIIKDFESMYELSNSQSSLHSLVSGKAYMLLAGSECLFEY